MSKIISSILEMQDFRSQLVNKTVGFVPTMGTLHDGHLELIKNSLKNNDVTVVSIFVNPMQFNNANDFETYPNKISSDLELLKILNVDAVFTPTKDQIYPRGYDFKMSENKDSIGLCGTARPGHFDGVLTVLLKLFHLVKPSNVYMGLKDYQQYLLVKNMADDLFMDIQIQGVETVRDSSGLALSSRNLNLTEDQKKIADKYAQIFASDDDLVSIKAELEKLDLNIDYLTERWGRKFVAVFIGKVRLIDNRPYRYSKQTTDQMTYQENEKTINQPDYFLKENSKLISRNILFKMSGSISCYKACDVISKLVQAGHKVKVAVTPDTFNFVGQATLEGLSQNKVMSDMYTPGQMMEHIHLNDWCDLTLLCPATANTIAKVAMGLSDNIVTALALSRDTKKPYLLMPAMNSRMLSAEATQDSLSKLENRGVKIIYGDSGHLACGHIGSGRLAEPSLILKHIENIFESTQKSSIEKLNANVGSQSKPNPASNLNIISTEKTKILITAGGTAEPIDPVRTVTNVSTGQTGLAIAEMLSGRLKEKDLDNYSSEYEVTLLGSSAMKSKVENLKLPVKFVSYTSFNDLELKMQSILSSEEFSAIVHLAAVSDYSPKKLNLENKTISLPSLEKISLDDVLNDEKQNLDQEQSSFSIEFKKNKKLITEIREYSKNKKIKVIAFKLLRTDDLQKINFEIEKVLKSSDFVVVNDLKNITESKHSYEIHNRQGLVLHGESKKDMSLDILKIIDGGYSL